jgi:Family of unknown function (DUF5681)
MPWQPGQSGNPGGSKVEKQFLQALKRAIAADDAKRLRAAAEALLDHAAAGEYWAINMLADRLDGKPTQQLQALDEEGRSVAVALITYSDTVQLQSKDISTPIIEGTGLRH